ncbi:MAG: hypothetical protein ACR2OC_09510 [Solirubrobacterales bacterium]
MTVTALEARGQILDDLSNATDAIALAASCLGEAYEELDDATAERMEDVLFRPVQKAYGRSKRTRSQFAERFGLKTRALESPSPPAGTKGAKALIEKAVSASAEAGGWITELQDSMLPIEAGDAELRAGLAEVRESIDGVPASARELLRGLGR